MRRAKVLLIGEAGTGKTHAALTFPKPVVIDAEGSIDWFADRFSFKAVATKSYTDVRDLIRQVREGQVDCETLVIDGWTTIYNGLINTASAGGSDDLRPLDWGRIKRKNSSMTDELYHRLPVHVVCIGWLGAEYAKAGTMVEGQKVKKGDLVQIGEKLDGDKKTAHAFDFIFKILGNDGKKTRALVLKSRSGKLKNGQTVDDFSWKTIAPLLGQGEQTYRGMTDEEQVARDAPNMASDDPKPNPKPAAAKPATATLDELFARWSVATFIEPAYDAQERGEFAAEMKGLTIAQIRAAVEAAEKADVERARGDEMRPAAPEVRATDSPGVEGSPNAVKDVAGRAERPAQSATSGRAVSKSAPDFASRAQNEAALADDSVNTRAVTGEQPPHPSSGLLQKGTVPASGASVAQAAATRNAPSSASAPAVSHDETRRRRMFALHGDLAHDDAARRMVYERLCHKTSSKDLSPHEVERVIADLEWQLQEAAS